MNKHRFAHYAAGILAICFVSLLDRARRSAALRAHCTAVSVALVTVAWFTPTPAYAAGLLPEGATVRAEFTQLEAGWHEGTLRRAQNDCWMIFLNKPTKDRYTLIALTTATRIQVKRNGQWTDARFTDNLQDQPASCREEGSD
jgi:hypothetical protein